MFLPLLHLLRPLNGLIASLSLILSGYLFNGRFEFLYLEMTALFFVVSYGYAVNDLLDQVSDTITKPERVIPAGKITPNMAKATAIVCLLVSITTALFSSSTMIIYIIIIAIILTIYSYKLSSLPVVGNIIVSIAASSVFLLFPILKSTAKGNWDLIITALIFSFLFHLGREIVKDIQDIKGDLAVNRKTLPIIFGSKDSVVIVMVIFGVYFAAAYSAYFALQLSLSFILVVTFFVNLPIVIGIYIWLLPLSENGAEKFSFLLKILMLPGLLVLFLMR